MDFANLDIATAIGDVIALAALVTSIVSIRKSNKAESLQAKVSELDAKLKAYELADAEEGRKACVEARAISVGKGRRLRITTSARSLPGKWTSRSWTRIGLGWS